MMGQLADICQTEKYVSVLVLKQWVNMLEIELTQYLACSADEPNNQALTLKQLKTLLAAANKDNASTVISCCV
jgi:hypothetical protein